MHYHYVTSARQIFRMVLVLLCFSGQVALLLQGCTAPTAGGLALFVSGSSNLVFFLVT